MTASTTNPPASPPRRAERVAALAIAALTLAGWTALALEAGRAGWGADALWQAVCRPVGLERGADLAGLAADYAVAAGFWVAMTMAMMLPTAAPMALSYAEEAAGGGFGPRPASPLVLIAGYLAVWTPVALAAAALQVGGGLALAWLAPPPRVAAALAGLAMGAAGLYQFSDYKLACLSFCRHPLDAAAARAGRTGVFRLGVGQGVRCVGCCWAMMALMLAAGTMNIVWMAVFAVLMTLEKTSSGVWMPRLIGAGLIAAGFAVAAGEAGLDALTRVLRA
ncbi:DUF2182 domain-containing protein [Alsobacter sp. SYSU M60028]|uniref:DUF2182 domain-containing protein n=1 Tax=Alsobacter ponti TaxID=2962936 RepID=A0ABT1LGX1_9HYPH|nr:DUF2182 domain-containing protein [Alsobacter ponti]MCP8939498.1 DUF2182 domain-containing protein [Alsobacter ponti]